ncbi:MAG: class IV adenylate cyclase [Planctomycetaceae bacterium]|nr:class IV adenylate cyclase [Planctomycetaceae bacterium]
MNQAQTLARNIELKARLPNLAAAREVAVRIATRYLGIQRQIDTYFVASHGRLKLREIDEPRLAQLVWYERANTSDAKSSDYRLVEVANPSELKAALSAALGVRLAVDKRREIFLYDNVRIHLDEVVNLGTFLEFEAVLNAQINDQRGHEQLAWLREQFSIADEQLIDVSYSDLLER